MVHKFGYIRALPGENELSRSVSDLTYGLSQSAGLPDAFRSGFLGGRDWPKCDPEGSGGAVTIQDFGRAMHIWCVPAHEFVPASCGAEQPAGAFDVVVDNGAPRSPEGAKRLVEGLQPLIEQVRLAEHLSVVDVPFVACAQSEGKVLRASLAKGKRTLDRTETSLCSAPRLVATSVPDGSVVTDGCSCCQHVHGEASLKWA